MARLAITVDSYDTDFAVRAVGHADLIEITPDRWAEPGHSAATIAERARRFLAPLAAERPLILHGVGLSIGSHDCFSSDYLGLLDDLFTAFRPLWHSEHLAYCDVDGEALGTMVELPCNDEALELICPRVERIQDRYAVPFLLENVARAFPRDDDDTYASADFMNRIVRRTGCGLLLDVHNLRCDVQNFGVDAAAFLDELDVDAVREIHISGGTDYKGFRLDIHSRLVDEMTFDLARLALARCRNAQVLVFEVLGESVATLGVSAIAAEMVRLRSLLAN